KLQPNTEPEYHKKTAETGRDNGKSGMDHMDKPNKVEQAKASEIKIPRCNKSVWKTISRLRPLNDRKPFCPEETELPTSYWIIKGSQQELVRREFIKEFGIDPGTEEKIVSDEYAYQF
ncbi:9205_t:CDS:2, partial [Racocetra persica]